VPTARVRARTVTSAGGGGEVLEGARWPEKKRRRKGKLEEEEI
jgi:hypothetical protein